MLFKELEGVKWDIIGLGEFRRTRQVFIELKNGYVICYRGRNIKKEHKVGFSVNKKLSENILTFCSVRG